VMLAISLSDDNGRWQVSMLYAVVSI
jgi:hypothetical protein